MSNRRRNIISNLIKNITSKRFIFLFGVLLIIINEYFLHFTYYQNWAPIPLKTRNSGNMVLLIVSDPQIQGYRRESSFPMGYLSRWDSDRYIRRSFSRAFYHTSPDVIIFLGDLMDEGSIATNKEYDFYYKRMQNIFQAASKTKKIYVLGDNDIGCKYEGDRTREKIYRSERYFGNLTETVNFRFASFYKFDICTVNSFIPKLEKILKETREENSMPFRIVLNHETISTKLKIDVFSLLKPIQPHLVVSGHWHKARFAPCEKCVSVANEKEYMPVLSRNPSLEHGFIKIKSDEKNTLFEIVVPSCSYQIGEPNMGYGVLIINSNGSIKYMTLWLPPRYICLYIYAGYTVYVCIIITCHIFRKRLSFRRRLLNRTQVNHYT